MQLLICVVMHNRLEYSKQCLRSIIENTDSDRLNHFVVVVDNASTDGTQEWLKTEEAVYLTDKIIVNTMNRYPGAACNQGWMMGLRQFTDATHLCRLDNDCVVHEEWWTDPESCFKSFDKLGQFGLVNMNDSHEFPCVVEECDGEKMNFGVLNVGGPNIILRELWDQGLRYDESPWMNFGQPLGQEDVRLSLQLKSMGYRFGNTVHDIMTEMSFGNTDDYFDYYCRTFQQRGHGIPARTKNFEVIEKGTSSRGDHI